jgi:hypothetical protein
METFTIKAQDGRGEDIEREYATLGFPKVGERLQYTSPRSFWTVTEIDIPNRVVYAGQPEYL